MATQESVVRSSVWYGIEIVLTLVGGMISAIIVANHFGPERLRDFLWVSWLANVSGLMGTAGLPMTVQKYVAEYLGKEDKPTALAVFSTATRIQFGIGLAMVAAGSLLAILFMGPGQTLASVFLVMSILPRILAFMPSQVNMAAGDWKANVPASVSGSFLQIFLTLAAVALNLDLWAVALSMVIGYSLELFMKMKAAGRVFAGVTAAPLDPALRTRMIRFSTEGLGLLILNLVVWDRSDIAFLKYLNNDKTQIAFFSSAFTLTEKLLTLPQIVGAPMSMALLGQAGRDRARLLSMTTLAGVYLAVLSVPLLAGAAAVGPALWALLYKPVWAPAVPVLVTMILLAIPRALSYPAQQMLRAEERQDVLLKISISAAVVNLTLDLALVPGYGAMGAAIGNGCAQASAAIATWFLVWKIYRIDVPYSTLGRLLLSSALMGAVAAAIVWALPPAVALPLAVSAGFLVFILLMRWLRVLGPEDRERLLGASKGIPAAVQPVMRRLLLAVIPAAR